MFESRSGSGFEVGPPRRFQFDLSTWEGRMAARAAERRLVAEIEERLQDAADAAARRAALPEGTDWLNGWTLMGESTHVLIGSGIHCAGCGRCLGVTCVAIDEDWVWPEREPDWPYRPSDCPVCSDYPKQNSVVFR